MKKLFVSLLCVVMMVTFMPSMAFADGETSLVSEVGTVEDLNAALKAEGEINLKLTGPIDGTVVIPAGKTVKLDLNGQTVKAENNAIEVVNGASLTITDTSGAGLVEGGFCGVYVKGDNSENPTKFKLESGKIVGYYYGVSGNGLCDGTEITIAGGSVEGTCEGDNLGIYHPQEGTLNITGGHVEGYTGIQICDGTLNMTDGTVVGNKPEKADKPYKNPNESDGSIMDGSAISVVSRGGGYGDKIEINISGGEIISANKGNEAVNSYSWKKGADGFVVNPSEIEDVAEGTISGGTFSSVPAEKFFNKERFVPVINEEGGCSVYTTEYANSNFVQDDEGNYFESNEAAGVKHTAVVVTAEGQAFYDDLAAAVAAAEDGTVTLLQDVTLDKPLVISKSITLEGEHSITGAKDADRVILVDGEDIAVTLVDIEIINGGGKHGLQIQNGSVTVNGVSIDNRETKGGAPVIVNPETTAAFNDLTLTLGENSWYGVNVDGATATFAGVTVTDETLQPTQSVICAENTKDSAEPVVNGSKLTVVTTEDGQIAYVADQNLSQFVAAKKDKNVSKIELNSDVELTAPLVISEKMDIIGNGHAIKGTAALGGENVVTVMADEVKLSGITIETDAVNKSGLHIYKTTDTALTDVKVIVKGSGAGILVNGAAVTVNGKLDFELGEVSWGGINVEVQDGEIPKVTFNDGSKVTVKGDKPAIYQDKGNVDEGKAEINGAKDAGLKQNADGSYEVEDTTSGGGGIIIPPAAQKPNIEADEHAKVTLGSDGTTATITVDEGYELADVVLNGVSQGKITFVYGLKTGDVLKVTTVKKGETEAEKNARLKAGVENTTIKLKSTLGKGYIKLNWTKSEGYKVDKYQVFRSTKRYSGYGTKAYFTTKQGGLKAWYKNTKELKKGNRYYYKVRGVREIAGETVYTQWSNKAWRTIK